MSIVLNSSSKKVITLLVMAASLTACSLFSGRETGGQYVDDTTITAKVKEAFVADKQLKSWQVNVETMQGVVQLSGFVDSESSERRAVQLAEQVNGVKDVQDNITVRSSR